MIKDLQQKTFKLSVENNIKEANPDLEERVLQQENSEGLIVMKRRKDIGLKLSQDLAKIKILDNQLFDAEGNMLNGSARNSFYVQKHTHTHTHTNS